MHKMIRVLCKNSHWFIWTFPLDLIYFLLFLFGLLIINPFPSGFIVSFNFIPKQSILDSPLSISLDSELVSLHSHFLRKLSYATWLSMCAGISKSVDPTITLIQTLCLVSSCFFVALWLHLPYKFNL